jgi:hypothetical protein
VAPVTKPYNWLTTGAAQRIGEFFSLGLLTKFFLLQSYPPCTCIGTRTYSFIALAAWRSHISRSFPSPWSANPYQGSPNSTPARKLCGRTNKPSASAAHIDADGIDNTATLLTDTLPRLLLLTARLPVPGSDRRRSEPQSLPIRYPSPALQSHKQHTIGLRLQGYFCLTCRSLCLRAPVSASFAHQGPDKQATF